MDDGFTLGLWLLLLAAALTPALRTSLLVELAIGVAASASLVLLTATLTAEALVVVVMAMMAVMTVAVVEMLLLTLVALLVVLLWLRRCLGAFLSSRGWTGSGFSWGRGR
jgi:hypothetical protein